MKATEVGELSGGTASEWVKKLPLRPAKQHMGELIGDSVRLWRLRHLARIMDKVHLSADRRGLDSTQAEVLALHVGLPWIEKASLCENDELQDGWVELFLTLTTDEHAEYSARATHVRILGELDAWDCKVLDYMVKEDGLSKSFFREMLFWEELMGAVPAPKGDPSRTVLSIETD